LWRYVNLDVSYARTTSGLRIGFVVLGSGPLTLVLVPGVLAQVEVAWEEPSWARFLDMLASSGRVVVFDRRGIGLSDRPPGEAEVSPSALCDDIDAVLDATRTERAVLVGYSYGGQTAVAFAATRPWRTRALVLLGTPVHTLRTQGCRTGPTQAEFEQYLGSVAASWGTGSEAARYAPLLVGDRRLKAWFGRLERHSCSPREIVTALRAAGSVDVRNMLGEVAAPCLVLHSARDPAFDVAHGRYLSAFIAGARYVELRGVDHDRRAAGRAITSFVDEVVAGRPTSRHHPTTTSVDGAWSALTETEVNVALLVATGLTNAEVGRRLTMSRYTVDTHLRRIYQTLGIANRTELARVVARATGDA
jgi:pimeloyl-ACP methyl ester carboxylesterase/DNA-binding CsgD family transcriptional regulator